MVDILRENSQLDEYFVYLKRVQKNVNLKGSNISSLIASITFTLLYVFVVSLFLSKFDFNDAITYVFLLINILSFCITVCIGRYMYLRLKSPEKIYNKATMIVVLIDNAKFYIILINAIHILLSALINVDKNMGLSFSEENTSFLMMGFALAIVCYYFLIIIRRDLIYFVKKEINTKILANFSFIKIKTKEREFEGGIKDIFDEEIIILKNNESINMCKWDEIISISILESNTT